MEERARRITLGRYLLIAVLLLFAGTIVVRGLPETLFIDRQGRIVDHVSGALPTLRSLEQRIAAMAP